MSGFDGEYLRGLTYLATVLMFLPKFYIDTILLPQTNHIIKVDTVSLGKFLWFIIILPLVTSNPGYNRRDVFFGGGLKFWRLAGRL